MEAVGIVYASMTLARTLNAKKMAMPKGMIMKRTILLLFLDALLFFKTFGGWIVLFVFATRMKLSERLAAILERDMEAKGRHAGKQADQIAPLAFAWYKKSVLMSAQFYLDKLTIMSSRERFLWQDLTQFGEIGKRNIHDLTTIFLMDSHAVVNLMDLVVAN